MTVLGPSGEPNSYATISGHKVTLTAAEQKYRHALEEMTAIEATIRSRPEDRQPYWRRLEENMGRLSRPRPR